MQKTTMMKKEEVTEKKWYVIDAKNQVLGRLAVVAADILRGKNKPNFTPNVDCGDYLIIINTDQIKLTGNKASNEYAYSHSMYLGGLKSRSYKEMVDHYSDELVRDAIKGMMPKNRLSSKMMNKLHLFKNEGHSHNAQQPVAYNIKVK